MQKQVKQTVDEAAAAGTLHSTAWESVPLPVRDNRHDRKRERLYNEAHSFLGPGERPGDRGRERDDRRDDRRDRRDDRRDRDEHYDRRHDYGHYDRDRDRRDRRRY